ncbi:phosphoribosyl-AMP cyclohydrolase [candidate division KSB1 bacterium]|nr:phosphoribosyl-AMP cyclohydrolase [candidate division KSB1 bacterium]
MINLNFAKGNGLLPVIAQDAQSGEVLMMAFMNEAAWQRTLETGIVHYYSRTRGKLWMKGETSGNIQKVKEIRVDCDDDCVLIKIDQVGDAACHTGYKSCFYRKVNDGDLVVDGVKVFNPEEKYGDKK